MSCSAREALMLVRCSEMSFPAAENSRSDEAEEAGMQRIDRANLASVGTTDSLDFQKARMSPSASFGFGSLWRKTSIW